ncbi:MAG TPA: IclR family transcriptional regulator [Sphingomonadaceae bacterium]|nr:IclR family transcriptional regulator [Sphingomonadaceae bacterium]
MAPPSPPPAGAPPVKSAMRTLDILELVAGQGRSMAAHEIAGALAIPVSSLAYLLTTLVERGYLSRTDRRYASGPALRRLASLEGEQRLIARAAPLVRSLRTQLNETASFFLRRGFEIEAVVTETGVHALRYAVEIGQHAPLHSFSAGKAILASLNPAAFEDYLAKSARERFTANTIVEADALRAEIAAVRHSGIARTREEHTPGIMGIGHAVTAGGVAVGALSLAIPAARFNAGVEARAAALLTRSAALLSSDEAG